IWCNPAFATSTSRNQQSEGTYVTDVIVPLLRASVEGERMGKKPDIMMLIMAEEKVFELGYIESSRINCSKTKKDDDYMKLWREILDGVSLIDATYRPKTNQFGIVGIQ
ncbi:8881_t:CDS:2, partial [Scutellospora calospora]